MPEIKQKQPQERKTIFETLSLPVAKILSPVARQAPTKNRCACNWSKNSQRILVCNWDVHRKYLVEAPELHKTIPAKKPCVTDVLPV